MLRWQLWDHRNIKGNLSAMAFFPTPISSTPSLAAETVSEPFPHRPINTADSSLPIHSAPAIPPQVTPNHEVTCPPRCPSPSSLPGPEWTSPRKCWGGSRPGAARRGPGHGCLLCRGWKFCSPMCSWEMPARLIEAQGPDCRWALETGQDKPTSITWICVDWTSTFSSTKQRVRAR